MKNNYDKEIKEALSNTDRELGLISEKVTLVLVGGASLILQQAIPRSSSDVDHINKLTCSDEVTAILIKNGINNRVSTYEQTYGIWQDDTKEIENQDYKNISLYTISLERQAASRLFSKNRFDDVLEITKKSGFSKTKFEEYINEIFGYCNPIYTPEFIGNKELVESLYKKKGWDYESSNIKKLYEKKS